MRTPRTLIAGLGLLALLAVAAAWLSGGRLEAPERALAVGPFDTTYITCSDVYLDVDPQSAKDAPPGAEDILVAKALVRVEPGPADPDPPPDDLGKVNITTMGYGGITTGSINPPDTQTCADDQAAGNPEANRFDDDQKFNHPNEDFGHITAVGQLVDKDANTVADHIEFTTCFFSPTVGWVRSDTNMPLFKTSGPKGVVNGESDLYLITPTDDTPCDGPLPTPLHLVTIDRERDAATDDPTQVSAEVVADPDGTAGTPPPIPQPVDGADGILDDWDGDGCTDWDELGNKAGGDPFNPEDCDKNLDGVYNILVTVAPSGKNPNGSTAPGIYFHCITRINDPKTPGVRPITANLICYSDNGIIGGGSAIVRHITRQDGLAGAPPPPPYGSGELNTLSGSFDPGANIIALSGCFTSVEGELGPNVYVIATFNDKTGKGTVSVNTTETKADCNAGTPSGGPGPQVIPVELVEQPDGFDHDEDGCTDSQELDPTGARLGNDPYNPSDCLNAATSDFTGIYTALAIQTPQDVTPPATPIPGLYYHCTIKIEDGGPVGTVRNATTTLHCYADTPGILVNGHVDIAPAGPNAGVDAGDGLGGVAPPGLSGAGTQGGFAEVHASHPSGVGSISAAGVLSFPSGVCFDNTHGPLGRVFINNVSLDLLGHPASGTVDIYINQPNAGCAGSPMGAPSATGVPFQLVAQARGTMAAPPNYDGDRDNCTDWEELTNTGGSGGLRDPYNIGDFMSVHTGPVANLAKDAVVSTGDISAIVARFGSTDGGLATPNKINRNSDPKARPPAPPTYHPGYDRGGPIPNGGAGGVQRQIPANVGAGAGAIVTGDISATVAQFGHSCAGLPN